LAIKTEFSIKDLENLSGVKAHTIRIWEKRYNLFSPDRTDTNIRKYNLEGLKKLLSVTQLYNQGHKISKIASLSATEIHDLSKNKTTASLDIYYINEFKTAMFSFDHVLFNATFKEMEKQYTFVEAFEGILVPLLAELGHLWQTGTIDPVHERYISELIRQKITIQIDTALERNPKKSDQVIALFLPYNEIHELSLLYAQYLVISAGFQTLYLGSNIPLQNLNHVIKHHKKVTFMTYLTTEPADVNLYIENFNNHVCKDKKFTLWCLGSKAKEINTEKITKNIKVITEIKEFKKQINQLANV